MLDFVLRLPRRLGLQTNLVQGMDRMYRSANVVGFLNWPEEVIKAFKQAAPNCCGV